MIGSRSCKALAAALVGGLSCSILLAVPGKVVTKQGDTFEGEVQDRRADQGVVIITTADGRKVQVKAGNVDRIQPLARPEGAPDEAPGAPPGFDVPPTPAPRPAPAPGSVEADLRNRLAALPKNDVTNRIKLARAALPRREYGVARDCLDQALRLDPRNQEAADLLRTVDAQQRMDQRA